MDGRERWRRRPACTQALIQAATQAALLPGEKIVKSGPYQCAGIWAYNAPTISSASGAQSQVINLMRWNGSVPGLIYQKTCQK